MRLLQFTNKIERIKYVAYKELIDIVVPLLDKYKSDEWDEPFIVVEPACESARYILDNIDIAYLDELKLIFKWNNSAPFYTFTALDKRELEQEIDKNKNNYEMAKFYGEMIKRLLLDL